MATTTDNGATTIRVATPPDGSEISDLLLRAYAEHAGTFPRPGPAAALAYRLELREA